MHYELYQIFLSALILFVGGFLQSTVGFAYGLFAIPLLMMVGIPVEEVIAVIIVSSSVQGLLAARSLKEYIPRDYIVLPAVLRAIFVVFGVVLLQIIVDFNKQLMQAIIGAVLIISVLALWLVPRRPSTEVKTSWLYVAAPSSGIIGGLIGMGGPPLLLWAIFQPWEPKQLRAWLFTMFLSTLPLQLVIMFIIFGWYIAWGAALGLMCFPVIYLGTRFGVALGNKLSKKQLEILVYIILLILGIKSVYNYLYPA